MNVLAIGVDDPHLILLTMPIEIAAVMKAGAVSGVKSSRMPFPSPANWYICRSWELASVTGRCVGKSLTATPRAAAELDHPTVCVRRDRVRRGDGDLLDARADQSLRGTDVAVPRAHVRLDDRGSAEALGLDARADDGEALGLVVLPVRPALGEARVADDADDLVALDQLPGQCGFLCRVELLGVLDVLDRPALDPAVVVDALEVRRGHLGDGGEVDAGDQHVDRAQLDGPSRRLLPGAQAAHGLLRRGLAGPDGSLRRGLTRPHRPGRQHQGEDPAGCQRNPGRYRLRSHCSSFGPPACR